MHNVPLTQLQQKSKTFMHCIQPDPYVSFDLNQSLLPVFDLNQSAFRPEPLLIRPDPAGHRPLNVVEVDTARHFSPVYGGFGLLLSSRFVELLNDELMVLENVLLPIDDLIQAIYRRFQLKVGIAFPFLVIPETRESSNMGDFHANFANFVRERLHVPQLENYAYVNYRIRLDRKQFSISYRIGLRTILDWESPCWMPPCVAGELQLPAIKLK